MPILNNSGGLSPNGGAGICCGPVVVSSAEAMDMATMVVDMVGTLCRAGATGVRAAPSLPSLLLPHIHRHFTKVLGISRGEYNAINSVVK